MLTRSQTYEIRNYSYSNKQVAIEYLALVFSLDKSVEQVKLVMESTIRCGKVLKSEHTFWKTALEKLDEFEKSPNWGEKLSKYYRERIHYAMTAF